MASFDQPVTFLVPDVSRTGAPIALLRLLQWIKHDGALPFRIVLYQNGPLADEFAELAPTTILTDIGIGKTTWIRRLGKAPVIGRFLKEFWNIVCGQRAVGSSSVVYANSVAASRLIRQVTPSRAKVILHVHELEQAIQAAAGPVGMRALKSVTNRYVAVSEEVKTNLVLKHRIDQAAIEVVPPPIVVSDVPATEIEEVRIATRSKLGIPAKAIVVGGCGPVSWRKGTDLFIDLAEVLVRESGGLQIHFVWTGPAKGDQFSERILRRCGQPKMKDIMHLLGEQRSTFEIFCGLDIFALTSREDPMPLVVAEAAALGKTVLCFADSGGTPGFVGSECGIVVQERSGVAMAKAVKSLLAVPALLKKLGDNAREKALRTHSLAVTAPRILELIKQTAGEAKISEQLN